VSGLVLISDYKPKVDEVLRMIQMLDVEGTQPLIETIFTQYEPATQVAAMVTAAATARETMTTEALKGKVLAGTEGESVVVICPPDEIEQWRTLISKFDQKQAVVTRTYSPRHFGVAEVAKVIEQSAKITGPRGSGTQWRLITEDLTGSLVVTAT